MGKVRFVISGDVPATIYPLSTINVLLHELIRQLVLLESDHLETPDLLATLPLRWETVNNFEFFRIELEETNDPS